MSGTAIELGQQYTASVWVRAPLGQPMVLVARVTDPNRLWRGESPKAFVGTGDWQRVTHTVTGTGATAGNLLALQVQTGTPYPAAGASFELAGPQIEVGPTATDFEVTAP